MSWGDHELGYRPCGPMRRTHAWLFAKPCGIARESDRLSHARVGVTLGGEVFEGPALH